MTACVRLSSRSHLFRVQVLHRVTVGAGCRRFRAVEDKALHAGDAEPAALALGQEAAGRHTVDGLLALATFALRGPGPGLNGGGSGWSLALDAPEPPAVDRLAAHDVRAG